MASLALPLGLDLPQHLGSLLWRELRQRALDGGVEPSLVAPLKGA